LFNKTAQRQRVRKMTNLWRYLISFYKETAGNDIEVQKQDASYFLFATWEKDKIVSLVCTIVKVISRVFRTSRLRAEIRKKKWLLEFSLHTPRDIYLRGLETLRNAWRNKKFATCLGALSYLNKNTNAVM